MGPEAMGLGWRWRCLVRQEENLYSTGELGAGAMEDECIWLGGAEGVQEAGGGEERGLCPGTLTLVIFIFPKSVTAMGAKYNPGCPDKFEFQINSG